MGGLDSEVTNNTKNVLLETAIFDSQRVRSSSKKFAYVLNQVLALKKGTNVSKLNESGEQGFALLMAQLSGGQIADGVKGLTNSIRTMLKLAFTITLREKKLEIITLTKDDIIKIIDRLGFEVEFNEKEFIVDVPGQDVGYFN